MIEYVPGAEIAIDGLATTDDGEKVTPAEGEAIHE